MSKLNIFIYLFIFPTILFAKLGSYEVSGANQLSFSYGEVCAEMLEQNHFLVIQPVGKTGLDCMGNQVIVFDFCQKKLKEDGTFLRGFVDQSSRKVVCQKGNSAIVTVDCDSRDKQYCRSSRVGCKRIKKYFAAQLNTIHHSVVSNDDSNLQQLNCYFASSKEEELEFALKLE